MPSLVTEYPKGVTGLFWWVAPEGEVTVGGNAQAVAPSVTGTQTFALANLGESEAVTVGSDRRTLSGAFDASAWDGLAGPLYGRASVSFANGAVHAVRIQRVTADTVYLADTLPVDAGSAGTLVSRVWRGSLPAAVTNSLDRNWTVIVQYTIDKGGALGSISDADRMTIAVVPRPFRTGLDLERFAQFVPQPAAAYNDRELSRENAIVEAFADLTARLRPWAEQSGRFLDQTDGAPFARAHAYLAAAHLLAGRVAAGEEGAIEAHEAMVAAAEAEIARVQASAVWFDEDDDGLIDDDERSVRPPATVLHNWSVAARAAAVADGLEIRSLESPR